MNSGESFSVADGLTVVVGPNNSGKSQLLREIHERLTGGAVRVHYMPKVVALVESEQNCNAEDFLEWVRAKRKGFKPGEYGHGASNEEHFSLPDSPNRFVTSSELKTIWTNRALHYPQIGGWLFNYLPPGQAAGSIGNVQAFHVGREAPAGPLQLMYTSREFERIASDEMRNAFGESLTLHRYAGSMISLHVGSVIAEETVTPASADYLDEIEKLPLLQEQGDGVRSYMGMVLTVLAASYPVLILDEPETFLHPPQAYMLGNFLARQCENGMQVLLATHSDDMLRGIASAAAPDQGVTVVRLTRSSAGNHVAQVSVEDVRRLYRDPLIKYYGVLDGLFFHGSVICEGDSDCTYYRAVLESTVETLADGHPTTALNLHFMHCGGKSRIVHAVRALRAARVPVACVVDVDFLQGERDFVELIKACGGDPESLRGARNVILNAIGNDSEKVEKDVFRLKINKILELRRGDLLTSGDCQKIRQLVSPESGWRRFKRLGRDFLSGGAISAFDVLDQSLRGLGIFLVPVGELESFHRDVPCENKASWLREVLETRCYADSEKATNYVTAVANFIWQHQDQAATTAGKIVGEGR
ncbi:AAA family ATPase [Solwaraspora sp. WMMD792]|uniref:ATP-dependent nuclease n=1 Tax=Solwaraspora sp. WMMD792 TaxID=3016099 RepID=UPI002415FFA7|nr:AAA family ATPase [Solwaraspora sp. WMMD792]MDG4773008.1 AAA family ATPase [Solwaraspora sp. WMMD792]